MAVIPYKWFRHYRIPQGAREDYLRQAADYVADEGEVFIVSFPKCGTTWLQHIVYLLSTRGQPADSIEQVISSIPFPEQDGFPADSKCFAIKYHLPLELMRLKPGAKYLYIARNPKDACVSSYHFLKNLPGYNIENFDFFFEAFLAGEMPYGNILDHFLSWYKVFHLPNVLFLTYESLFTERAITRINHFLGHPELQEHTLRDILNYSSFDFMKFLATKDNFLKQYLMGSTGKCCDKKNSSEEPRMMRKGVVGDWRNYFSSNQSLRMNKHFSMKCAGTKLTEVWQTEMNM